MAKKRTPIVAGAYVAEGPRVQWDAPKLSMAALSAWVGERITITIARETQQRSQRAHNYLFGVIYTEAVAAFHVRGDENVSVVRLHHLMKLAHNWEDIDNPITGEIVRVGKSTKDLPVQDFCDFVEKVMFDLSTLLGIVFSPPRAHEDYRQAA